MSRTKDVSMLRSRRDVLKGAVGLAVLTTCAGCGLFRSLSDPDVVLPAGTATIRLQGADHAALSSPGGVVRIVVGDDTRIRLVRGKDGAIQALSMSCTHFGSDLGYDGDAGVLACPSHGSRFSLDGAVIEGPADEPLERWGVTEEGGLITVELG